MNSNNGYESSASTVAKNTMFTEFYLRIKAARGEPVRAMLEK